MFISSLEAKAILAFSLPSMRFMLKLGEPGSGPGQFNRPNKLCVAPNGNLITADDENYRLVEMSQDGVFVRTFGGAPIDGYIISVAMSSDGLVAAGKGRDQGGDQVYIFDYRTGCVVRSFGRRGTGPGELHSCAGMRFTPNGRHLVIAERRNSRLSVFTPVGEFVRLIGVGFLDNPRDLDFADNGDLLVLETERGEVSVFSPLESGAVFLRRFGSLASPTACTVHNGELYVIEDSSRTVRVFN